MAKIAPVSFLSPIDLYASDTVAPGAEFIGQMQEGLSGKWFRYVKAGASALVVGNVLQSPAVDTQFTNMTVPAAVATATVGPITITNGTTVLTGGELKGGSLSVYTTPGLCEEYTILDNGAAGSGAALSVYLDRPIRTAWTTSTKVNLRASIYNGVIQSPATTLTGVPVGVAIYAIPALSWGWVQTHGVASVLSDGSSILVGSAVAAPSGTAGAVILASAGLAPVGTAMQAAAAAHGIAAFLTID